MSFCTAIIVLHIYLLNVTYLIMPKLHIPNNLCYICRRLYSNMELYTADWDIFILALYFCIRSLRL